MSDSIMLDASGWAKGEQGVWTNLPAADYHKALGFSNSMGKNLSPPARLPHYLTEGIETTVEMIMGTLCHQAVLEPGVDFPQIAVKPATYPGMDGKIPKEKKWTRGADYCAAWEDAEAAKGKIVLSADEMKRVNGMISALTDNEDPDMHEYLRKVFEDCDTEVSVFRDATVQIGARDDGSVIHHTILRKARLDIVPRKWNFLADVKTVPKGGADKLEFQRKLYDMDYFVQAASNLSIARDSGMGDRSRFLFIVIERDPPYCVATYMLEPDSSALRLGTLEWDRRMTVFARCSHRKHWPGYQPGAVPIDLAAFAAKALEAE